MGLLITRPSVFVWGLEDCLRFSSVSWKGAPSTKKICICGSVNLAVCWLRLFL